MAYCPARPPELTHLLTIHLFRHSPTRASSSNSIFTLLLLCSPSYLTPWLVHRNFLPQFLSSYTFSLSSILLMISPGLPRCTSLLRLLLPSSLHIKTINSHPCYHSPSLITPTSPPFRRRLLRIVLRFFGCCPRAGLFAATTLSRFWNSVATYAWLGLALAVSCAGGFTSHLTSHKSVFHKKYSIKGQHFVNLFPTYPPPSATCTLALA